ncbi:MAG TPA: glycosyltransferase [Acidimicrobiales bacterium]|nr:glycosyltransferase [Acidimicrobiales bacterium]
MLWFAKGLGRGGTERILASSIRYMDRARFDVEVAYVLPWKDAMVQEIEARGITVHCLEGARGNVNWPLRLRSLVYERQYSIVHTHMPYPAAVARMVLHRSGPALIHTEHNVWDRFRLWTREANSLTMSRNAAVIAVSRAVADSMTKPHLAPWLGRPAVEVIYHGIDVDGVRAGEEIRVAARRVLGLAPTNFVIGTVGNLTPKKDHRTLLEAAVVLMRRHDNVRIVIMGDGPLRQDLEAAAQALGIADRVTFTGSRPDVPELLAALDAFVLSSQFEGFPIALVEAMATGLPCVATSVGGTPELMTDHNNGILVKPGDAAVLAGGLDELIMNPELRQAISRQAASDALKYGLRDAVERLQCIYSEVLAGR